MVLPGSSGKTALPKLTAKLKLRQRTGFFDSFETPDRRLRREAALRRSATRTKTKGVMDAILPALRARKIREARERLQRVGEDQAREASLARMTDIERQPIADRLLEITRAKRLQREREERAEQETNIADARRRFKDVERRDKPMTTDEAKEAISGKPLTKRRVESQFRRQEERSRDLGRVPPKTPLEAVDRVQDALKLTDDQRTEVLREMSRRGDDNVTVEDVYRFGLNVKDGKGAAALPKGKFVEAQFPFKSTGPPEAPGFEFTPEPIETTTSRRGGGDVIPKHLPLTTSQGRLLADWQSQFSEAGYRDFEANVSGAREFASRVAELRVDLRDRLVASGIDEEQVDRNLDGFVEREIRRAELFAEALREYHAQDPRVLEYAPDEETLEDIENQVNAVVAEEFAEFNVIADFRPESVLDKALSIATGPLDVSVTIPEGTGKFLEKAGVLPGGTGGVIPSRISTGRIIKSGFGFLSIADFISGSALSVAEQVVTLAPVRVFAMAAARKAGIPVPEELDFLTMTPTGVVREIGRRTGLESLEQIEASPLSTVMNLARSEEERKVRMNLGAVGDVPFLGEELEQSLAELLIGLERGGMMEALLPDEVLDKAEAVPYAGPSLRRELELLSSPLGLASFLIPGFGKLLLYGAVGGVAAGGATRAAGIAEEDALFGLSIEETAQISGNVIAVPGVGRMSLKLMLRGPMRPMREIINLYDPVLLGSIKEVKAPIARKLAAEIATNMGDDTVDLRVVWGSNPVAAMNAQASMGSQGLAWQTANNMYSMGVPLKLIPELLRSITRVAREGPAALKSIPKAVQDNKIFQGMVANLRAGEAGGGRLGGKALADKVQDALNFAEKTRLQKLGIDPQGIDDAATLAKVRAEAPDIADKLEPIFARGAEAGGAAERQALLDSAKAKFAITSDLENGSSFMGHDGAILKVSAEPGSHAKIMGVLSAESRKAADVVAEYMERSGSVRLTKSIGLDNKVSFTAELRAPPSENQLMRLARLANENPDSSLFIDMFKAGAEDVSPFRTFTRRAGETVGELIRELKGMKALPEYIRDLLAGGEEGGLRLTADGVKLTPKAEKVMALAAEGKPLERKLVLAAAEAEGLAGQRRIIMSNEAIIEELVAKKRMFERLMETKAAIAAGPKPSGAAVAEARTVVAKGSKATLAELRAAA